MVLRLFVPALLACALILGLGGCAKKPSFDGTWVVTGLPGMPADAVATMTFTSPDKWNQQVDIKIPATTGQASVTAEGTYTFDEAKSEITFKATKMGMKTSGVPAAMESMIRSQFNEKQMIEQVNAQPPSKITWEGKDTFKAESNGMTATFTRKASS